MKLMVYLSIFCLFCINLYAEKVPAGYVAKWDTISLSDQDYEMKTEKTCQSFEGTLKKGKIEMPHIIPFKIINKTLINFKNGYKINNKESSLDLINKIDTVYARLEANFSGIERLLSFFRLKK